MRTFSKREIRNVNVYKTLGAIFLPRKVVVDNGHENPKLTTFKNLKNTVELQIIQGFCEDIEKKVDFELPGGHGSTRISLGELKQISEREIEVVMVSSCQNGKQATTPTESRRTSGKSTNKYR
ncbi:hypothetical protein ElyMa_003125700 [Elysia marginata]|uniref:Uncharacterized protein n=1 Tax=Elysia marginata TaxID=1093978 RepID=A0AAV4IW88_9GAST|nr:hypothetical protein ElyMa_003125700 [Elysia marginata]